MTACKRVSAKLLLVIALPILLVSCGADQGAIRAVFQDVGTPIHAVFHPRDPHRLLVTTREGEVGLWDVSDPDQWIKVASVDALAREAAFLADGESFVTAGTDGAIRRWALDGSKAGIYLGHHGAVTALAVDPNGRLISGGVDGTVRAWDLTTGSRTVLASDPRPVWALAVSPRGDRIAVGRNDGTIVLLGPSGVLLDPWIDTSNVRNPGLIGTGGLAFSPDGSILAASGGESTVRLFEMEGDKETVLRGHDSKVLAIAFSPDSQLLASADLDGTLRLWSVSGEARRRPLLLSGPASSVAWAPNGENLVTVAQVSDSQSQVQLWSRGGAQLLWRRQSERRSPSRLAFDPSSSWIVSVYSRSGAARLWDREGNLQSEILEEQRVAAVSDGSGPVPDWFRPGASALAVSPDGATLALGLKDGWVQIRHLDGSLLHEAFQAHDDMVFSIAFEPSGRYLVTADFNGEIRLWDVRGSAIGPTVDLEERYPILGFSSDGGWLAAGGWEGGLRLWSVGEEGLSTEVSLGDFGVGIAAIWFSPATSQLAVVDAHGRLRFWRPEAPATLVSQVQLDTSPLAVAFSPTEPWLVTLGADGAIRKWRFDGRPRGGPLQGPTGRVYIPGGLFSGLAISPDGTLLAISGFSGYLWLWELSASPLGQPLVSQQPEHVGIAVAPAEKLAAAVDLNDRAVRLWRLEGELEAQLPGPGLLPLRSLSFDAEAGLLAGGGRNGELLLWDWSQKTPQIIQAHEEEITKVGISPSAGYVATSSRDGAVRIWNRDGSQRAELVPPSLRDPLRAGPQFLALAVSPTGSRLAAAENVGVIRVWSLGASAAPVLLHDHEDKVSALAFLPDETGLVSGGADGTVRLWHLAPSPSGKILYRHGDFIPSRSGHPMVTTVTVSADGQRLASADDHGTVRIWSFGDRALIAEWFAGQPARELHFDGERLWVLLAGHRLVALDEAARPTVQIQLRNDGVIAATPEAWIAGTEGPLDTGLELFHGEQRLGLAARVARLSRARVEEGITGRRDWWAAVYDQAILLWRRGRAFYSALPTSFKIGVWPAFLYGLLVLGVLILFAVRPAVLARWAMPSDETAELPRLQGWILALSFIQWSGGRGRCLDAWLRACWAELEGRSFSGRPSVQDRRAFADLGNASEIEAFVEAFEERQPSALWIHGPGGSGKSTLAYELARRLIEASQKKNAKQWWRWRKPGPVLPILVEDDWRGELLDHLGDRLKIRGRRPTLTMLRRLLRGGRLLPVVDGLSERRVEGAETQVRELARKGEARYLVVTSRLGSEGADFRTVEVGALTRERLPDFVAAYEPDRARRQKLVRRLEPLTRQPVRPLFTRLAIERLQGGHDLPSSLLRLVQDYLQALREKSEMPRDDFLRAARRVAWECVKEDLAPRDVTTEDLRRQLGDVDVPFCDQAGDKLGPPQVITQLEQAGLLERHEGLGVERVRFAHDPIAEYLAAMHVYEEGIEERARWHSNFETEAARGFSEALKQVLEAKENRV